MGAKLHASQLATPLSARGSSRLPPRVPLQERVVQDVGEEGVCEDVSSPEAARARTSAVTLNYKEIQTPASLGVRTPVRPGALGTPVTLRRNPSVPLHRAVLLSSGVCAHVHVRM